MTQPPLRLKLFFIAIYLVLATFAQYSPSREIQVALAKIQSSTCLIIFDGLYTCTGTLINNTSNDGRPLILSAAHCLENPDQIESIVVIFGRHKLINDSNLDAIEWRSSFGADLRAISYPGDYLLLELREEVPFELMPVYLGWNSKATQQSVVSTIHHPSFEYKQFTHSRRQPSISSFSGIESAFDNGFWKVGSWTMGRTVEGSSGAALLDDQIRIIGGLSGSGIRGADTVDYFFRFDLATADSNFRKYIDPGNTGANSSSLIDLSNLGSLSKIISYDYTDSLVGFLPIRRNEMLEQEFDQLVSGTLKGIYLTIGDIAGDLLNSFTIQITSNEQVLHVEEINLFTLDQHAENYIPFLTDVEVSGSFTMELRLNSFIDSEAVFIPFVNHGGKDVTLNGLLVESGVYHEEDDSENDSEEIVLFPNPTQDFFIVNRVVEKAELITSKGTTIPVFVQLNFANQTIVDVSNISSGLYYSNIYLADGKVLHYRIVIR